MKKFIFIAYIFLNMNFLQAGIPTKKAEYYGPTEMLIARESWEQIEPILTRKRKILKDLFPFFDSIAAEEDWGHMGYHGANHGFRFYQDIIKFTIEEVIHIPIEDNFQFLRWPGDPDLNLNSVTEFVRYWEKKDAVDNRDKIRAKQLLSMNYGIYSNFDTAGSCTVGLFAHDKSSIEINYVEELIPFYEKIGITKSKESLTKLQSIFNTYLTEKSGILLQISEDSHLSHPKNEAYNFADNQCYPALRGGYLFDDKLVSAHYKAAMTEDYINKEKNISHQLRLVLNNQHTLNPYSHLKIKRWDRQNPNNLAAYEKAMRTAIRNLKYDKNKWLKYNDYLLKTWKQVKK
jgi:hypothetical protein